LDPTAAAAAVADAGLVSRRLGPAELPTLVAQAIAAGRIVGWARGRAEIGQRALGARSIVADPRDRRSLERLNRLKGREMWRPVAPSVLAEHVDELVQGPVGHPTRFMLSAMSVRPEARRRLPAVTHVDGSARPQLVERETNPGYWSLIDAFRALTGVPAVVNTSFNLADEPIVHTAANAVATFVRSELDLLVLDDLLVARSETDLPAAAG
jgi:carbamoyltransferase